MRQRWLILSVSVLGLFAATLSDADGCAPAMRDGDGVGINAEMALIAWNSKTRTEHFVRSAEFLTDAKDFGFLVPTPTEPTLAEVNAGIFKRLDILTRAKTRYKNVVTSVFRMFAAGPGAGRETSASPSRGSVQILNQQTVAGYDAAVLKANDATALAEWLEANDYVVRPALAEWLTTYVENDWVITAFKFSRQTDAARSVYAQPVRLSLKTDKPFYPYREPADMRGEEVAERGGKRQLRVFFLSDERYEGTLGEAGPNPAQTAFANSIDADMLFSIKGSTKLSEEELGLTANSWVTEFEDNSWPRNGIDELYFHKSQDQSTVERPTIWRNRNTTDYYPNLPRATMWLGLAFLLPAVWILKKKFAANRSVR